MHSKALVQALYNVGNMLTQRSVAAVYGKELAKLRKAGSLEDAVERINKLVTKTALSHPIFHIVENVPNALGSVAMIDINFPKTGGWLQITVLCARDDAKQPVIAEINLYDNHEYGSDELLTLNWAYELAFGDSLVYEPDARKRTNKNVELNYAFNLDQSSKWAEFDICLDALIMGRLFSPESMVLLELAKVPATRP